MASRYKLPYHRRLFVMLLGFSWILVACFVAFQYHREKQYKVDMLDSNLQLYNAHLIDAIENDSIDFTASVNELQRPMENMRISIIGIDGTVSYDNTLDSLPAESHLDRPEIAQAIATGTGYTIRRHSRSTHTNYFYSATRKGNIIVRSAVPYSMSLQEVLDADRSFLWFMLIVTLLISILGYFATRRIGRTITRLNQFAAQAESGANCDIVAFPHDELGSISNHIIRLYARLQQTMVERDREHKKAMFEQEEKNRIKKQLTNNINHELKTPVASIKVCLETILAHRDLPADKHWQFVEQCYANTERLTNLLNDVAAITRMDDGVAGITKEPSDLADVIADVQSTVAEQVAKAQMQLHINVPQHMPINGNRTFLTSIFRNLIDNAIAYSGGTDITLEMVDETHDTYTFCVADNGVGIPDEHLERIFERFYRIDKGRSRRAGGTGLGLSIVRNAVQLHGGTIYAANRPDRGVKFIFTLAKH